VATGVGVVVAAAAVAGCTRGDNPTFTSTRFSMGTVVEYTIAGLEPPQARVAVEAAQAEIDRVAGLLWEGDSLSSIYQINTSAPDVQLSDEVSDFLDRAAEITQQTRGAFDVTIGSVLALYDFDEGAQPPSVLAIADRLRLVGLPGLEWLQEEIASSEGDTARAFDAAAGLRLSVGGIAKGYAVDRAAAVLREHGVENAIVNAGGDMICLGTNAGRPWRVGIRDPRDPAGIVAVLEVTDAAVATSGDYQQFFEHEGVRYHHILDPSTGRPARGVRSATVVTSSAERADALATAVFVLGARGGLALMDSIGGAEGMVIDRDGLLVESAGFGRYLSDGGE